MNAVVVSMPAVLIVGGLIIHATLKRLQRRSPPGFALVSCLVFMVLLVEIGMLTRSLA